MNETLVNVSNFLQRDFVCELQTEITAYTATTIVLS